MATEEIKSLHSTIKALFAETNKKIESYHTEVKADIANIHSELSKHKDRIEQIENTLKADDNNVKISEMQLHIELLKQHQLRNNIRFTGLPSIAYNDPDEAILRIDSVLKTDLVPSDYTFYADRNKSSIIVAFTNYNLKRLVMDKMKEKQSLFVEEIYDIDSDSRVFINDQLTPYFANLFQNAWRAKKDGTIFSASSVGGRIKVKKTEQSQPIIVQTESQLNDIISNDGEKVSTHESSSITRTETHTNNTKSHRSQTVSQDKTESPSSIDSNQVRTIREKTFTHLKHSNSQPKHQNRQFQSNSRARQQLEHNQHQQQRYQQDYPPNPSQKRNNRHINSLDYKTQQPHDKRRFTAKHTSNSSGTKSRETRSEYQNRLRSYIKH